MNEIITSSSNSIIKETKSLHKKRDRWKLQNFFVEGIRAVEECVKSKVKTEYIIYSDMLFDIKGGRSLFDEIILMDYKLYYVSDKIFQEISDTEKPQGVMAVVKHDLKKIEEVLMPESNFLIFLDKVQDPGNMGTIIRTADAFGANGVIVIDGCVDIYNPKTIRSTMGSIFHIPIIYYESANDVINDLKKNNISVITTSLNADQYCYDVDFKDSFALVIGNEASGVSEETKKNSDILIKIPMLGDAESLNAAIASSVIMYEVSRQRMKNIY